MFAETSHSDLALTSDVFPGGSLVNAVFDRHLMRLSDRGGASGLIGDRWADMCATALSGSVLERVEIPAATQRIAIDRVVRLDDIPAIALAASRQKLQNPDFVLVGSNGSGPVMFSADAKFSVETATASQVSAESLQALMQIGPVIEEHLGDLGEAVNCVDGTFLCPDYSLTHFMLARRRGARKASVEPEQVTFLPVSPTAFIAPVEASSLIPIFAGVDDLPLDHRQSLLLTLYYFRLVRAGIGCWFDQTGPLLEFREKPTLVLDAVGEQACRFASQARTGWEAIERWDALAETVRKQRTAINQVTSLPIVNRELRRQVDEAAAGAHVVPPSLNKVRRRIGSWFRERLREDFGPIIPPVDDFASLLMRISDRARELRPEVATATETIINEFLSEANAIEDATV